MRKIALVVAAVALAFFSPWMASPDDGALLWTWFNWLPTYAALWMMPATDGAALALNVLVLTVQYLWLFSFIAYLRPLATVTSDFLSAPRHRSGLVR